MTKDERIGCRLPAADLRAFEAKCKQVDRKPANQLERLVRLWTSGNIAEMSWAVDETPKPKKDFPVQESGSKQESVTLPAWAKLHKYEYDLGMSTACEYCGGSLDVEGRAEDWVWKDTENANAYYCSETCVRKADVPPEPKETK